MCKNLLDNAETNRPERRTALVAKELACYKVDIAALSETCLPDKGQLIECSCGYTFFWSGCSDEEWRESGVGFAIKSQIVWKLANLPKGNSYQLMTLQLPLGNNKRKLDMTRLKHKPTAEALHSDLASWGNSKAIPTQPQRKQLLPISTKKCKAHCIRCRMSGLAKRQMKFRAMQISMTQSISMRHWNVFMVLSHLDPHHSSVQMEPSSSLIVTKSWRDGLNISALFSTILHQSMMRQFTTFCKFQSIMNSMHHPLFVKLRRPLGSYQMARHLGLMLHQPKSINMVDLCCSRSWLTSSSPYGSKVLYCKTSRMYLSFISTSEKEIANNVTITVAYHSCP